MIFNYFNYSEISNSSDGYDDNQFTGYEDVEKRNKIIHIKNNDELYLNKYYVANSDLMNNHF